jgi:hypothetical protein
VLIWRDRGIVAVVLARALEVRLNARHDAELEAALIAEGFVEHTVPHVVWQLVVAKHRSPARAFETTNVPVGTAPSGGHTEGRRHRPPRLSLCWSIASCISRTGFRQTQAPEHTRASLRSAPPPVPPPKLGQGAGTGAGRTCTRSLLLPHVLSGCCGVC